MQRDKAYVDVGVFLHVLQLRHFAGESICTSGTHLGNKRTHCAPHMHEFIIHIYMYAHIYAMCVHVCVCARWRV